MQLVCVKSSSLPYELVLTKPHQLISMLDILLARMDTETKKKKLQEEHNLPMTIKLEKEMNDMCNLSSGIREESRLEGKLEGRVETTIEFIKNIMFKKHSSAEEAMELLGINKAEYPRYLAMLQN